MKRALAALAAIALSTGAVHASEAQTLMRKLVSAEATTLPELGSLCPFYEEGRLFFAGIEQSIGDYDFANAYSKQAVLSARVYDNSGPELRRVLMLTCQALVDRLDAVETQ